MQTPWYRITTCLLVLLLGACSDREQAATADRILVNGKILAVDADFSVAEALAIRGDRILALGSTEQITALQGPQTSVIDLAGRTVVPGLIDNHNHFARAAAQWFREVRWDEVDSRTRALGLLQERAAQLPAGEWIVVLGGWVPEQFRDDQRPFQRYELDALLPDNPVYIQEGYTRGFANSLALASAGLVPGAPLAEGVEINDGEITGVLNGAGAFLSVSQRIPPVPDATWDSSLRATVQDYLAQGLTALLDIGGNTVTPRHYEVLRRNAAEQPLDMRVYFTLNATNGVGPTADDIQQALTATPPRSGDDHFGQFTYGEMTFQGIADPAGAVWAPDAQAIDAYRAILHTAASHGWQIHEHSTRDDKMQLVLELMAEVDATAPIAPLRWTIAHGEQASDATIARARELGVAFALHSSGGLGAVAAAAAGEDVSRVPPIRQIEEAGVRWGLGSDGTVVSGHHPFQNIGWAVSGLARSGERLLQATVSREAALRAHTISNAWLLGKEDVLGSLEPGKYADLVVLDRDYLNIPEAEIQYIRPVLTLVGGRVVYSAP